MAMTSPDPLPVICDGLPSQREGHRRVQQHLGWVVHRAWSAPRRERRAQRHIQPRGPDRPGQQRPTGVRDRRLTERVDPLPRVATDSLLHLEALLDSDALSFRKIHHARSGALFMSPQRYLREIARLGALQPIASSYGFMRKLVLVLYNAHRDTGSRSSGLAQRTWTRSIWH